VLTPGALSDDLTGFFHADQIATLSRTPLPSGSLSRPKLLDGGWWMRDSTKRQ
jgi:hypothetical protein